MDFKMSLSLTLPLLLLLLLRFVFFGFPYFSFGLLYAFVLLMTLLPYSFLALKTWIQSFLMTRDTDIDGHMLGYVLFCFHFFFVWFGCRRCRSCGLPYRMSNVMLVWCMVIYITWCTEGMENDEDNKTQQ